MEKIWAFIKKPTSLNVFINTFGNYLNVFFTALFALMLWQIMTPTQYGVMSVLLGISYVLANILDFGTTATIYSNLPTLVEQKAPNVYRFIKSTAFYQSIFACSVIAILLITFPILDKVFFKTGAPKIELYLTAISVLFYIWQNFASNILFATKKFFKANLYINLSNIIKTAVLFYFVYTGKVTVGSVIFIFGILGPTLFFLFLFWEKRAHVFEILKADVRREEFKFGYTITYFLATQFFNLGLRMDLFLLSFYGLKEAVGFYGVSQKIILTIIATVVSITQVLSPHFSRITNKKELQSEVKGGLMYMLIPCGLFILLFILPDQVYTLFFGKKHIVGAAGQIAAITRALCLPFILYALGTIPMLFILYTVKKPLYILVSNIFLFLTVTLGCIYLIPEKQVFGPPLAIFIALIIANTVLIIGSIKEYNRWKT